jgi:hypothetical protein
MSVSVNKAGNHGSSLQIDLSGRVSHQRFAATNITDIDYFAVLDRDGGGSWIVIINSNDLAIKVDGVGDGRLLSC